MRGVTGGGAVGHVRLPIVGLGEEFDQPVVRGPWTIAFVGEVLDFRDQDLNAACDLDVVANGWNQEGPTCLRGHDGFWSVVAHYGPDQSLHLLCDYLAQKPLYYRADYVAAASELDAVAAFGSCHPDEIYFASVAKWGYCPETWRTPYLEVNRVLPGECVELTADGEVRRQIVDPLLPVERMLKTEIELAVKRRVLSSDVPVACLVSGGLDSSIVYTLAKRHGHVRPYYASDGKATLDERLAVSAVAPKGVKEINWSVVSPRVALDYMQEPIDLGSLIPQVALSDQIEERVCLTGDGADEFFGGYGRASRYDSQRSDVFHELVAWHLPRLDRIMMRNRVEVRSPFLARRVAEAALTLPWRLRKDKRVLRDLFRRDLPAGIADRPKVPLRTSAVARDREAETLKLIRMFRDTVWGRVLDFPARVNEP